MRRRGCVQCVQCAPVRVVEEDFFHDEVGDGVCEHFSRGWEIVRVEAKTSSRVQREHRVRDCSVEDSNVEKRRLNRTPHFCRRCLKVMTSS